MANDLTSIRDELDTLTRVIAQTVPVEAIYLFGSWAYGAPRKNSDFDLYVVLKDDTAMPEGEAMDAIGRDTYKIRNRAMDILVHKKAKFLDRSTGITTIERTVSREGLKIYG